MDMVNPPSHLPRTFSGRTLSSIKLALGIINPIPIPEMANPPTTQTTSEARETRKYPRLMAMKATP